MVERVSADGGWKSVWQLWVASGPQGTAPVCTTMRSFSYLWGCHFSKYQLNYASFSSSCPLDVFHLPTCEDPSSSLHIGQSPRHPPCQNTDAFANRVHTPPIRPEQ